MRKDKLFCKNPIVVNNIAFPCMKCDICREQFTKMKNKYLKKNGLNHKEVNHECIF